jgi:creatinine amidohydrolase
MQRFWELNREELRVLAPSALAVLPVGATEQHGPHLATGMDFLTVERIAVEAAARASGLAPVVVAPVLAFGSSHHHLPFGATLSLRTETYYRVLMDLLESFVTCGFSRIFILNGHGGNQELAELAARDLVLKHRVRAAAGSYWHIAWDRLIELGAADGRLLPGHAGAFETSLLLSLRPELVSSGRPSRILDALPAPRQRAPFREESHDAWIRMDGFTDSPANASAERGRIWFDAIAESVAAAFRSFAPAGE